MASSQTGESQPPPKEVSVPDIPDLEQFYTSYTGLNAGWLYLIDENDPNLWYEYRVDGHGGYDPVYWKDNKDEEGDYKDIREASGDRKNQIIVEKDSVLWAAYSPVQWSTDYHKSMRDDAGKRKERMTKITCSGFQKGSSGDKYFQPYDETQVTFSEDPRDPQPIAHQMNSTLEQILADEKAQEEDPTNDNTLREDMFVTLHDPIGCMQDVNEELADAILEFQALIEAIQTGETREDAYARLANGNFDPPEPDQEYGELLSLALTCYTMVYNDEDKIEQYDGTDEVVKYNRKGIEYESTKIKYGLDRKKVEGILGKKEREQCRKKMKKLRDAFGTLLKDPYCRSTLDDYLHNLPEQHLAGRASIMTMLGNLHTGLYELDRPFLLRKEVPEKTDRWKKFVWSLCDERSPCKELGGGPSSKAPGYEGEDPLEALLTSGLNVDKLIGETAQLNANLAGVLSKKLEFHAEQFDENLNQGRLTWRVMVRRNRQMVERVNNSITVYEEELVAVRSGEIQLRLEEMGVDLDGAYLNLTAASAETRIREAIATHSQTRINVQTRVETPSKTEIAANKFNEKAARILNSQAFTGALAAVQILNFRAVMVKLVKDPLNIKNQANIAGVTAELTEAVGMFRKSYVETIIGQEASSGLTKIIRRAGRIGGAISAILCFWDAVKAFGRRDQDAALAWIGAGVAFGVTIFATGPVGWIAAAVGLGLFVLANLLTDTKLQTYFKKFLLSDHTPLPKDGGESPMAYSRKLLSQKRDLMTGSKYVKNMMHPAEAEATLYDLIVCRQMTFTPQNPTSTGSGYNPYTNSLGVQQVTATSFEVTMQFMHFLPPPEQVQCQAHLYPEGLRRSDPILLDTPREVRHHVTPEGADAINIRFRLPRRYRPQITERTTLVFAVRLAIEGSAPMHFPYPMDAPPLAGGTDPPAGHHRDDGRFYPATKGTDCSAT